MGDADDGRLADGVVGHDGVLEFDRGDPLAAAFDHVLGTVDDLDVALVVDGDDIAGFEPRALEVRFVRVGTFEVRVGHPRAANVEFTEVLPVPLDFLAVVVDYFELEAGDDKSLFAAFVVLLVGREVAEALFDVGDGPDWRHFGHSPGVDDVDAQVVVLLDQALGGRAAANDDALERGKIRVVFFEILEDAEPDRRHACGERDAFLLDERNKVGGGRRGAGIDVFRAGGSGRER